MGKKTNTKNCFGARRRTTFNTSGLNRGNQRPAAITSTDGILPPPSPPPINYRQVQQLPPLSSASDLESAFLERSESVVTIPQVMSVGSELRNQFTTHMDVSMSDESHDELEVLDEQIEEVNISTLNQVSNCFSQVQHEVNEGNSNQDNSELQANYMENVFGTCETNEGDDETCSREALNMKEYEGLEILQAEKFLSIIKSIKHVSGNQITFLYFFHPCFVTTKWNIQKKNFMKLLLC